MGHDDDVEQAICVDSLCRLTNKIAHRIDLQQDKGTQGRAKEGKRKRRQKRGGENVRITKPGRIIKSQKKDRKLLRKERKGKGK